MAARYRGSADHGPTREADSAVFAVILEERNDEFGNTAGGS